MKKLVLWCSVLLFSYDSSLEVVGPDTASVVSPPQYTELSATTLGKQHLAIYLSNDEGQWLGFVNGFKSIGIPFIVTDNLADALEYQCVILYPLVSGRLLTPDEIMMCQEHVFNGGTLIGFNVVGGLKELFGIISVKEDRVHHRCSFLLDHWSRGFVSKEETMVPIDRDFKTLGYLPFPEVRILASYEDKLPAITCHSYGKGMAIACGVDIGFYLARCYNRRAEINNATYCNTYFPACDVWLRWLKALYKDREANAVTLHPVPQGMPASVLITHDIDYIASYGNIAAYAEMESSLGIPATYFIQTKYIKDYNDRSFFEKESQNILHDLVSYGMEVASHSVAHVSDFAQIPEGTGRESYPSYEPMMIEKGRSKGATIFGELRVSKFLLQIFSEVEVTAFRPGHLLYPYCLAQLMEASGYQFASSAPSGEVRSYLPYQHFYNGEYSALTPIYEFPIALEDELHPRIIDGQYVAETLLNHLKRYGGCCTVLVHPEETGAKLAWLTSWLQEIKSTVWLDTVSRFGRWWHQRVNTKIDVLERGSKRIIICQSNEPICNLVLELPVGWQLKSPSQLGIQQKGSHLHIDSTEETLIVEFTSVF